jgi:hypothetical protein
MSSPAARQRARRARQAIGRIWVPTEIDEVVWMTELVAAGFLDPADVAIAAAHKAALRSG